MSQDTFFAERQGAAILKHGVLQRYLPPFASKVGSTSPGGRVTYLDAFAGAGGYRSGEPGSPMLAVQTAERFAESRLIETYLVERDLGTYEELCRNLAGAEHCTIRHGPIQRWLPEFMERAAGTPVFALFDPFGLLVPMRMLADVMNRPGTTEMMLTVSLPGLRRNCGKLKPPTSTHAPYLKARETILGIVDESLGGDWWRPMWASGAADRLDQIVAGYRDRLREATGEPAVWSVPVRDRWDSPPVYNLLFLTRHRDGMWLFHEVLSKAHEDFFQTTHAAPSFEDLLEYRQEQWIEHIKANIERLLPGGGFTTRQKIDEVFGETLGIARQTHVRAAIQRLHKENRVIWDGVVRKRERAFPDHYITAVP